jgi:hypothetical protein
LSSSLLSKNVKIKIHRILMLPVVLYGCETWSVKVVWFCHCFNVYPLTSSTKWLGNWKPLISHR